MANTQPDTMTPELRAAHRLADIANALHRHEGHAAANAIRDLANSLAVDDRDPAAQVARRDVALAVLGETAPPTFPARDFSKATRVRNNVTFTIRERIEGTDNWIVVGGPFASADTVTTEQLEALPEMRIDA